MSITGITPNANIYANNASADLGYFFGPVTVASWIFTPFVVAGGSLGGTALNNVTNGNIYSSWGPGGTAYSYGGSSDGVNFFNSSGSVFTRNIAFWEFYLMRVTADGTAAWLSIMNTTNQVSHTNIAAPGGSFDITTPDLLKQIGTTMSETSLGFAPFYVAEFWWAQMDVQPGGGQLDDALFRQLAFKGPFSVPHLAPYISEYHSFRQRGTPDQDTRGGNNYIRVGLPLKVDVQPSIGFSPHPPLAPNYRRPPFQNALSR